MKHRRRQDEDFALPAAWEMNVMAEGEAIKRGTRVVSAVMTPAGHLHVTTADGATFEIAPRK